MSASHNHAERNGRTPRRTTFTDEERTEFRQMVEAGRQEWIDQEQPQLPRVWPEYTDEDRKKLAEISERIDAQRKILGAMQEAILRYTGEIP